MQKHRENKQRPLLELDTIAGELCAILHEDGKMDYIKPIPKDMVPFFNALINMLRKK